VGSEGSQERVRLERYTGVCGVPLELGAQLVKELLDDLNVTRVLGVEVDDV
jgi:hypothetical protein